MKNILIVGAGMAGLIAANMLRRHNVTIWERAPELPHNHTAVLRFKTTAVSDATGIPFTRETVHKGLLLDSGVVVNEATIVDANRYSLMVTGGTLAPRSILNLKPGERWCAPRDFIAQMAKNLQIEFDMGFTNPAETKNGIWSAIISTMPMPRTMDMFSWVDQPKFTYMPVWTIKTLFDFPASAVCQTLYQTNVFSWYRATIHGQELTLEFMFDPEQGTNTKRKWCFDALTKFGIRIPNIIDRDAITVNKIPIGKILPIDEAVRKRFMLWLTEKFNVYSLGRFATWRNILLDDIVHDVKRIEGMIEKQSTYDLR